MKKALGVILFFALFVCSSCSLSTSEVILSSTESTQERQYREDKRFNLLGELEDENIQLYAISKWRQPPALALFRHENAFVFDWSIDAHHHEVYPIKMMLRKAISNSGTDELYIALVAGRGTAIQYEDLRIIQFTDIEHTEPDYYSETIHVDYSLVGSEFRDWLDAPLALMEPPNEDGNYTIELRGNEISAILPKEYDEAGDLRDIYYGDYVEFFFGDSGEITVEVGVCGEFSDPQWAYYGNFIGSVTAKVKFHNGKFTLSDYSFRQDA